MKLPVILAALMLFASSLAAQEQTKKQDPPVRKQQPTQQTVTPSTGSGQGFVDEDGDGINDRVQQGDKETPGSGKQHGLRKHRRDRFIDMDGDGIQDDRCGGTGLRQGHRHGAAKGGGE